MAGPAVTCRKTWNERDDASLQGQAACLQPDPILYLLGANLSVR